MAQSVEILSPTDNQLILSQRPVASIDSISRVNADGKSLIPYSVWTWDGLATVTLSPPSSIVNAPEIWADNDWFWRNISYQITYTHGYSVIPDDVVGVTAGMVLRVIMAPGSPGVISETIGGYSYRMADNFPTAQVELTAADIAILRPYRGRRNRTIEMR
ncbi:hypothetical protein [Kitasatospora mediocidica]|uniref:hypothetical protein n=1 Tax=Kitasatospora mediocidica TaxID=58352 RepID=UPI0012FB87F6|nr:hypothetical protein [Kitasatospora mediocidica]